MSRTIEIVEADRRTREAGEWLLRLEDRKLPDSQVAEWIRWCESDPKNLAAFERMESLWIDAGRATPPPLRRDPPRLFAWPLPFRHAALASSVLALMIGASATRRSRRACSLS